MQMRATTVRGKLRRHVKQLKDGGRSRKTDRIAGVAAATFTQRHRSALNRPPSTDGADSQSEWIRQYPPCYFLRQLTEKQTPFMAANSKRLPLGTNLAQVGALMTLCRRS